ncbi:MAG: Tm-1-like ATP-binding domain-containing protein [Candidatus Rokubacteria bacterium]|nr:Tm-1-like ATP-binding domain-containing protein [Candidatus Rokubacteria bacterium]
MTDRVVLVLGTLDTKGPEVAFLAEAIRRRGVSPRVLDLSVFGPPGAEADVAREAVARAAGTSVEALRSLGDRADALADMARGAIVHARHLLDEGRLAGLVAIGGSQGTVAATRVMAALPFGVPKLMVSTMASGNTRPYVGSADIAMLFPVVDLLGLNRFCRRSLENAAAAIAGMASAWRPTPPADAAEVALTAFGATTPCVMAAAARLRDAGFDPVVFHANGTGGQALETWIDRGEFGGVLDLTTTELADELAGGHRSAGPGRLEAAGRRGLPQVIAPGALDMVNFGPPDTVPVAYAGRCLHRHNAGTTLMRTTPPENARLGEWMAEKLNRATGPTGVVVPTRGFSAYDVAGGPFFDPVADAAFVTGLKAALRPGIPLRAVDAHLNDPAFAEAAVTLYRELAR